TDDNCSTTTVSNDAPASFPIGDTTVTWTVTDTAGNTATCTQIVTVVDNENPVFVETPPADATYECHLVPDAEILTATDNCGDVDVIFSEIRTDGSCASDYILERTWEVTDGNGLKTSHMQIITVTDTTAPELITALNKEITVSCADIPDAPILEFEDNCSSDVTVVYTETSTYNKSNTTNYNIFRTWTVSDTCGNTATYEQKLNVTYDNIITEVSDRVCTDNGTINLDSFLDKNVTGGNWTIMTGDATLSGDVFDPVNVELGTYMFSYSTTSGGCQNTTEVSLEVHTECVVLPCGREDVEISKVITPDGDMHNEYLTITGVETCGFIVDIQIFNRWGAKIYEKSNYKNDWNGYVHSNSVGSADKVPNGTYY
ncbi:MAG: HYR domain-containing protein, partial [Winogradskyella sp.]|nr:HYR domain-containing protein [Winogradskyella sp.]